MSGKTPARRDANGQHGRAQLTPEQATFSVGPLPPADEFERYERSLPGTGHRIVKLAEDEAIERREETRRDGNRTFIRITLGQILGFILIAGTVGAGVWLIYRGRETPGMAVAGGGLVTAIITYLKAYGPNRVE